jgi:hypothetical protein
MKKTVVGDMLPADDAGTFFLSDGPFVDLPVARATLNPDGSVTLPLEHPFKLELKQNGQVVRTEEYDHFLLRRLKGDEVQKAFAAKGFNDQALAISSGLGLGKLNQLGGKLDSTDYQDAIDILGALLGADDKGPLPPHAEDTGPAIVLPMLYPAFGADGVQIEALTFARMNVQKRKQVEQAPDQLVWGIGYATGMTPKDVKELLPNMDGADAVAVNRVVSFLCGAGRRNGR